jgi:hypothetical protein
VAVDDRQIEVNATEVRRALARTFTGGAAEDHAWRGSVGIGEVEVVVDVRTGADGRPYVHVAAPVTTSEHPPARVARLLVIENGELVLGRFSHQGSRVLVEHAILAGATMAAVEVQASVWLIGWAANAFVSRLDALLRDATPPPPAPSAPAALRRDAASHLEITDRRVKRFLDERFGGFEHDPAWGYHGGFGSARVFVDVVPVLESSTAVRASSPVLSDIDLSDELAIELLRLSAQRPFGGYSYVPSRREVWFEHAILGDDLDRLELEAAIEVVAEAADGDDDLLAGRFGGARYADLGR